MHGPVGPVGILPPSSIHVCCRDLARARAATCVYSAARFYAYRTCYSVRANSVLRYTYFCFWGYNLVLVVALGEFSESCGKEGLGFQGDWTGLSLSV